MLGWHHQLNWTWVWANSGNWWWTGKPGVLQSMGSQRVRHDWVTELNWTGTGRFLVKVVWVNTCEGTPSFWCNPSYLPISNLCAASPLPSWTKLFNNANTSLAWAAIASTAPTEIYIYNLGRGGEHSELFNQFIYKDVLSSPHPRHATQILMQECCSSRSWWQI